MGQTEQTPASRAVDAGAPPGRPATQQYLTFSLGGEMFAVAILNVKEIIQYGSVTDIPMMPAFIRGVINLRGAVVPVIDISCRFGGAPTKIARRTCVVIVELIEGEHKQDVGVLVDAVSAVLRIDAVEIEPAPHFGARIHADFIDGMGKINGKFVIILNIAKVLCTEEIAMLAKMADSDQDLAEVPVV
jgi:purine-binding chemotaxis protein CheW